MVNVGDVLESVYISELEDFLDAMLMYSSVAASKEAVCLFNLFFVPNDEVLRGGKK